jgi:two-component system, OmpR family, KDP operon response regulator KdpE
MKVLVVDDEPQIRRAVRAGLEQNGYEVAAAATGEEALDLAALRTPDAAIVDLAMPGLDGFAVILHLREWYQGPILVLSVREGEEDKIRALDLGADDYLTKPFGIGELLARLRAVLRRARPGEEEAPSFSIGGLHVDFSRRQVLVSGTEVHLTPIEYDLLRQLTLNADRVLTHRQLLTRVWGPEYAEETHTLRVHIANLRNKIEPDPNRPRYVQTEPRVGYRFLTS